MRSFDDFIKEYQGRSSESKEPTNNFLYQYCQHIIALVISDIENRNESADQYWYQEHKPEIRRLLKETVITTIWATGAPERINENSTGDK